MGCSRIGVGLVAALFLLSALSVSFAGKNYILEQGSRMCDESGRFCFDGYVSTYTQRQVVVEIKGRVAKGCDPGRVTFVLTGVNDKGARFHKEITVDIKGSYGEIIDKKVGIGRGISAQWTVERIIYQPAERGR